MLFLRTPRTSNQLGCSAHCAERSGDEKVVADLRGRDEHLGNAVLGCPRIEHDETTAMPVSFGRRRCCDGNLSQIQAVAALEVERRQTIGDGHILRDIQSVCHRHLPAPFPAERNHPAVAELTPQSLVTRNCCYHEVVPRSCRHTHNCTDFLRACNSRFVSIRFEEAMKYTCLPLLFTLACSMAGGDTLILKDGQKIEGRYLSSTDSAVQFEVNGKPFTYSIWLIRELRFHSGASSSAAPAPAYSGRRGKEQQDQFCTVLKNYIQARNKVAAEANPIRRAEMHPPDPWSFEDTIARVFGPNGEFVD